MGEGLPLPWPFPWSTRAKLMRQFGGARAAGEGAKIVPSKPADAPVDIVRKAADAALAEFGKSLPAVKSIELHHIRGLSTFSTGGAEVLGVLYPPEFLYILDVGLGARVGGLFSWDNVGAGDPTFPNAGKLVLRSIAGSADNDLIFPLSPGQLIISLNPGTSEAQVRTALEKEGLKGVEYLDFVAFARCAPFHEVATVAALQGKFDFVKNVSVDHIVRLIDFAPGWEVRRLL